MEIGIDLVDNAEFKTRLESGGQAFLNKHFTSSELKNMDKHGLASSFSAKEALFKTGFMPKLNFLQVQLLYKDEGKPVMCDINGQPLNEVKVSVTHTETLTIAVAVWTNSK